MEPLFTSYRHRTVKITTCAIFSAIGVVLSLPPINPFGSFTIFGAKIDPFAHFVNVLNGVLLGPWYAVLSSLIIASIRNGLGIGTLLAFPGGMSGALVVGLCQLVFVRRRSNRVFYAAFSEPLGTVFIGGTIAALIVTSTPLFTFWWLFALPSVVGTVLGWVVLIALYRAGYTTTFLPFLSARSYESGDGHENDSAQTPAVA